MITSDVLKKLESTPAMRQLRAQEAEETLKRRKEIATELERGEWFRHLTELTEALEKAAAALNAHDEGRKDLAVAYDTANLELRQARTKFDACRARLNAELHATADPRIDEGIEFFRARHEAILKTSINAGTRLEGKNLVHETQDLLSYSNYPSITQAAKYCRDCVELLEAMKLSPEFDPDALEVLKENIPNTETLTEWHGEKVLEGSRGPSPLAGLMGDGELKWRLEKLGEKIEKWKRGKLK